ncbi:hypothetical protein ACQP1P_47190 [Dactylosporangium sp. CA-052675]|uniref:hypothetical protein n=1 Tax=Dactylosporangium sp. CA-052675 TaxID=3239927 RepID=UPI003D8EB3F8
MRHDLIDEHIRDECGEKSGYDGDYGKSGIEQYWRGSDGAGGGNRGRRADSVFSDIEPDLHRIVRAAAQLGQERAAGGAQDHGRRREEDRGKGDHGRGRHDAVGDRSDAHVDHGETVADQHDREDGQARDGGRTLGE